MSRIKRTPAMWLTGIYQAITPFILQSGFTYQCIAIRSFLDVEKEDIKVFETYYQPKGLAPEIYAEDEEIDAAIITLKRSDGLLIYIPDTFIASYPLLEGLQYVRLSLMVDCGIIRDSIDTEFIENQIVSFIKQVINPPSVNVSRVLLPVKNTISIADQDALEAIRVANVQIHKTDYARVKELEQLVLSLQQIIDNQNQKLIDAGVPV